MKLKTFVQMNISNFNKIYNKPIEESILEKTHTIVHSMINYLWIIHVLLAIKEFILVKNLTIVCSAINNSMIIWLLLHTNEFKMEKTFKSKSFMQMNLVIVTKNVSALYCGVYF